MNYVIRSGKILQRDFGKMTIKWSFSYNSFVKFPGKKKNWEKQHNMLYSSPCSYIVYHMTLLLFSG